MYCSSCGVAVGPGLSFCNYCGEKLGGARTVIATASPQVKAETLVGAMVFTFVFGLGAITLLMGMMKAIIHLEGGLVLGFALLSFLIMLALEGVFIRLLLSRKRGAEPASDRSLKNGQITRELDAAPARGLAAPAASVTEHTTRAFDPLYLERTSK